MVEKEIDKWLGFRIYDLRIVEGILQDKLLKICDSIFVICK